ncbi:MAG: hypothetical protein LQ337_005940 [Flavoplaca oasis]|nr:MAG: hypothetical protein LQ337_005940 [Flavoplaca oasis]
MAPAKRKRQVNGAPSREMAIQNGFGNMDSHDLNDNDLAPRSQVLDTPFSIEMFQKISKHPYDDPTLPSKLNTVVHIRPEAIWASLSKYNSFIIRDHKYAVHHYVIVSRIEPLPGANDTIDGDAGICCPARILEIRARDAKNVYIRLYWLYTPEQLPNGRQPHHGKDELIATNHMEVIDAQRVLEPITVLDLKQTEESWQCSNQGMYWRQTYHVLTKELSVSLDEKTWKL